MATTAILEDEPEYKLFCRGGLADPYPFFHRLRATDPVHWSETMQSWVVTRYSDVSALLGDFKRLSSERMHLFMDHLTPEMRQEYRLLHDHICNWMVVLDPPRHTRLRALVSKAFTPRAVKLMEAQIREVVDQLLNTLARQEGAELMSQFAFPLPATIISAMLGVPDADQQAFGRWSAAIMDFLGGSRVTFPDLAPRAHASLLSMLDYFGGLIAERRAHPREDLLTALISASEDGDALSQEELAGMCNLLLIAGHETTTNLIGNGVLMFLRNPAEAARLRAQPGLIDSAIEECLRIESPLQRQNRIPTEDFELEGRVIRKGVPVMLMQGAANHDPAYVEDPDAFIIDRPNPKHVSFGVGIHHCLGAALARLEGRIALEAILTRFPTLRLASDDLRWRENINIRGLTALPVAW